VETTSENLALARRQALKALCALASIGMAPSRLWAMVEAGKIAEAPSLLIEVCDAVIPRTDTPGAVDAGVPGFVRLALDHGLAGTTGLSPMLEWLESQVKALGGPIASAVPAIDAQAYAEDGRTSPWRSLKALILLGYYTSKEGASQELHYQLVPGRFDPNVPWVPGSRNSSSDWTALIFG
jgi:hypothetical protein